MKKKLEADLISIAHRILQMKNKSDINQLYVESRKLYEKLTLLQFVEEHFEGAKPTIGQAEVVTKMEQFFEEDLLTEVKAVMPNVEVFADTIVEEETIEEVAVDQENDKDELADEESSPSTEVEFNETQPDAEAEQEEIKEDEPEKIVDLSFLPAFELDQEPDEISESPKKIESIQISFEELLGTDYTQTHFVRVAQNATDDNALDFELPKGLDISEETEDLEAKIQITPMDMEPKNVPTIEKLASVIPIGLNDKIAFVKHLFGNSDEDFNRVMNQLITFDSFKEAQVFIEDMVKPDYNNWEGKEDYELRFMEIIEKKFA